MERQDAEAAIIQAAQAWAEAKGAWEATARMRDRPENLSELKRNVRKAERELLTRLEALRDSQELPEG